MFIDSFLYTVDFNGFRMMSSAYDPEPFLVEVMLESVCFLVFPLETYRFLLGVTFSINIVLASY